MCYYKKSHLGLVKQQPRLYCDTIVVLRHALKACAHKFLWNACPIPDSQYHGGSKHCPHGQADSCSLKAIPSGRGCPTIHNSNKGRRRNHCSLPWDPCSAKSSSCGADLFSLALHKGRRRLLHLSVRPSFEKPQKTRAPKSSTMATTYTVFGSLYFMTILLSLFITHTTSFLSTTPRIFWTSNEGRRTSWTCPNKKQGGRFQLTSFSIRASLDGLDALSRTELQALAKKHGIK